MAPVRKHLFFYSFLLTGLLALLWSSHELGLITFADYFQTGLGIGLILVLVVLYPALFRQLERRLATLESRPLPMEYAITAAQPDEATDRAKPDRLSPQPLARPVEHSMNTKSFHNWLVMTAVFCVAVSFAQTHYPDVQDALYPLFGVLLFFLAWWCRATTRRLDALEQELSS
jgi:hypothetical protein